MWLKICWQNKHDDEGATIIPLPDGKPAIIRPRRAPMDGDAEGEASRLWYTVIYQGASADGRGYQKEQLEIQEPCSIFVMDAGKTVDHYRIKPHPIRDER